MNAFDVVSVWTDLEWKQFRGDNYENPWFWDWIDQILKKPKKVTINLDYINRVSWLIWLIKQLSLLDLPIDSFFDILKTYKVYESSKPLKYIEYYWTDNFDDFSNFDKNRILTIDILFERILKYKWDLKWFTMALLTFYGVVSNYAKEIEIDFNKNPSLFATQIDMNSL